MLLQERSYQLYHDGEIEGEVQCRQNSSNNKLRRSTFDLSSVNSLATSCSDSSSYSLPSPTRKASTLRRRVTSSSSNCNPSSTEGAASRALLLLAAHKDTKPALQEVRDEPRYTNQSLEQTQEESDLCTRRAPSTASCMSDIVSSHPDSTNSFVQYVLRVILLGYFVIPFLQLTITMERHLRSTFGDLHRNLGLVFTSLFVSSLQEEPIHFDGEEHCSNDSQGTYETVCCLSSSSSSSEGEEDDWGHFADFRDELADETSFIPSCSARPSCVTTLETLAEGREEDDDVGEDWSF